MQIQKGTRIVLRVAVPSAAGVASSGAVAEIVALPLDDQHAYRVRLPNGYETSVQRSEFALLSAFKSDDLARSPEAPTERGLRKKVICQSVIGSRAYGLEAPNSIRSLHERFDAAFAVSKLPERPDYATVNDYLVRARRNEFGSAS